MIVKMRVTKKEINTDGMTKVFLTPILVGESEVVVLSCDNLSVSIPTITDPFVLGADYQGELVKLVTEE